MTVSQPYASYPSPQQPVGYAPQPGPPFQALPAQQPPRPAPSGPTPNILNMIASEWTKLWTTRATL
jgi:hypothetical protein